MRNGSLHAFPGMPPVPALAARGGALRTFGGLAFLLAVVLFALGTYLIEDEFTNPLASQSLGLFTAAFLLASAMALLYELIQLPRSIWRKQAHAPAVPPSAAAPAGSTCPPDRSTNSTPGLMATTPATRNMAVKLPDHQNPCATNRPRRAPNGTPLDQRVDLPYQRCYVDQVRVRA